MKKYRMALLAAFAIILMLGVSSCTKDNPINSNTDEYDAPEWLLANPDNSAVDINEATLEQPCDMVPQGSDYRFNDENMMNQMMKGNQGMGNQGMGNQGMGNQMMKNRREFLPLARILRAMKLDSAQKVSLKGFVIDYRLCTKDALLALRESERAIIEPFNVQRKAILDKWKSGEITRTEAVQQLKDLNLQVRTALKDNPERLIACEEMKLCRQTLFDAIASVLTPDQLIQWNDWVAKVPVIDCTK